MRTVLIGPLAPKRGVGLSTCHIRTVGFGLSTRQTGATWPFVHLECGNALLRRIPVGA